jgi:hypothetical protein
MPFNPVEKILEEVFSKKGEEIFATIDIRQTERRLFNK